MNAIVGAGRAGCSDIYAVDEPETALAEIDRAVSSALASAGASTDDVEAAGFSLAGADWPEDHAFLRGELSRRLPRTAKLELVPLKSKFRAMFSRVLLWIDPKQDVSIRQQLFEPSGDYRLAHYTNIKLNGKIPGEVFEIKTTSHTKKIKPD